MGAAGSGRHCQIPAEPQRPWRHRSACRVAEGSSYLSGLAGAAARAGTSVVARRARARGLRAHKISRRASRVPGLHARPAALASRSPTRARPRRRGWAAPGGRGTASRRGPTPPAPGSASFPARARWPAGQLGTGNAAGNVRSSPGPAGAGADPPPTPTHPQPEGGTRVLRASQRSPDVSNSITSPLCHFLLGEHKVIKVT